MLFKKHTLRALALLVVAVMTVLTAAGCSASNPNPTVLTIGDLKIGMSNYYNTYNSYKSTYQSYGIYDVSSTESFRAFQDNVFDALVNGYLPLYWANKAGITLDEEEEATAQASFDEELESNYESFASSVDASITDEDAIREAEIKLFRKAIKDAGWKYDDYLDMMLQNYRNQLIMSKFMKSIYAEEVNITEEDARAHYDELIATKTAEYAETPASYYDDYSSYINENTLVEPLLAPEGYRFCKHLLITFAAEGETKDVDAIVAEVQEKINAGEDFDALIAQYGEDPGMQREPYISKGYLMSNDIIDKYYEGFGEAAMALENIGDISAPVETTAGYHFIQYTSDVSTDVVPYDTVAEAIMNQMITDAQSEVYSAHMETWMEETKITKYYNRVSNIR